MKSLIIFIILLASSSADAQWNLQFRIDTGADNAFDIIYFLDLPGQPRIGFAGATTGIWKTTNGGNSWRKTQCPANVLRNDFAFKDSLTGWCTGQDVVFKTTDGGETWNIIPDPVLGGSIYYNEKNGGLLISGDGEFAISFDDGATWDWQPNNGAEGGFAFANDDSGIVYGGGRTTDGGQTWSSSNFNIIGWQPLAIPGTRTYFMCEYGYNVNVPASDYGIYRTDDFGDSWTLLSEFSTPSIPPFSNGTYGYNFSTGCIRGDTNNLFTLFGWGAYRSTDQGITWKSLCGIRSTSNEAPVLRRFYVKYPYVYIGAADTDVPNMEVLNGFKIWEMDVDSLNLIPSNFSEQFDNGSKRETIPAGDTVRVDFLSDTALGPAVGVDSVSISISYNNLSLALAYFVPSSGWSIKDSFSAGGYYHLLLVASDTLSLANPNKLLRGVFASYLAIDSAKSKVYLDSIHLYGHRLNCDCAIESVLGIDTSHSITSALDSVEVDFTGCGDSLLLAAMEGLPPFSIVSIQPNPASSSIEINLRKTSPVSYSIFDALGHSVLSGADTPQKLDVTSLPSGGYYIRLNSNGYVQTRKIEIER